MNPAAPIVSAPLVWVELITSSVDRATQFYGGLLGWKVFGEPRTLDFAVYLDQARTAGPICGIRPRSPGDPAPLGHEGPVPDRWTVRLSPPRPPLAADPGGDQLLRPRSPGPRLGRWGLPSALCHAELRTGDVDGARLWIERRLDGVFEAVEPEAASAPSTLKLHSAVEPGVPVASVVDEADPLVAGWYPCVQVGSVEQTLEAALAAGALASRVRDVPAGCPGTAAAELTDPGGARVVLVENGPVGRVRR